MEVVTTAPNAKTIMVPSNVNVPRDGEESTALKVTIRNRVIIVSS